MKVTEEIAVAPAKSSKLKTGCLWVAGVFLGLVVLGTIIGGDGKDSKPTEGEKKGTAESASLPAPMSVTAGELFKAFQDNEVAAKAEYGDKQLAISGTVSDITLDLFDKPVVSLRTSNQFMSLQASGIDVDSAATLKKGAKVTLICGEVSEVAGTPMASDCSVQ
jgi:tRNA_anti-like